MKKVLFFTSIFVFLLVGCTTKEATGSFMKTGRIKCDDIDTIKTYDDYMLIDVRTPEEYAEDHLEHAINIEYQDVVSVLEEKHISKDTPIIVYCRSGARSGKAFDALKAAGYTHLYDLGAITNCK